MSLDAAKAERLGVFISYSRRDALDFADQLAKALEAFGYRTILDREGISGGELWQVRLGQMLLHCDTVVFVMSPESATSPVCAWEVEEAAKLAKRILPVIAMPLGAAKPPERLQQLNYIHFYAEKSVPGSGFGDGLVKLNVALKSDLDWLREHTRLLERATEWEKGSRTPNRMLSGTDIGQAKAWAARRPKDAPEPTALQLDYIKASEGYEASQQNERQRQLEEREGLVKQAEADRAGREAQQKRASRFAWALAGMAMLAAIGFAGFGIYSRQLSLTSEGRRIEAESEKERANGEAKRAEVAQAVAERRKAETEKLRGETLRTESGLLANAASAVLGPKDDGDAGGAALLALEALPDTAAGVARPFGLEAQVQLERAFRALKEQLVLGHDGAVYSAAFSADGTRIITASGDKTARVWDAATGKELARLGHDDTVWSAAFSADGARIVTASDDNTARVWDAATGKELARLGHDKEI